MRGFSVLFFFHESRDSGVVLVVPIILVVFEKGSGFC